MNDDTEMAEIMATAGKWASLVLPGNSGITFSMTNTVAISTYW